MALIICSCGFCDSNDYQLKTDHHQSKTQSRKEQGRDKDVYGLFQWQAGWSSKVQLQGAYFNDPVHTTTRSVSWKTGAGSSNVCQFYHCSFDLLNFSFIHYSFFYVVNAKDTDGERLIAINSLKKNLQELQLPNSLEKGFLFDNYFWNNYISMSKR